MRNPGRTATTSSALMVGLGLVVFVAVFAAGMKSTVNDSFDRLLKSDLIITNESFEPLPNQAGEAIAAVPGIRAHTPQFVDPVQVNGEPLDANVDILNGVDPAQLAPVYAFEWLHGGTDSCSSIYPGHSRRRPSSRSSSPRRTTSSSARTSSSGPPTGGCVHLEAIGEYRDPMLMQGVVVDQKTSRGSPRSRTRSPT